MIRKFLLPFAFVATLFCSAPSMPSAHAQLPPPPPPGGGGGSEVTPPVIPPTIPPVIPPVIPPTVTPPTFTFTQPGTFQAPTTPAAAATQITLPQFHSNIILPTDTLPFKVNGPLQVRLSQGKGMTTNFSVLLDQKSMLLVVAEKTQYTSETPIENPRVVTSSSTPEDNSPEAIAKREQEQQQLQDSLLMTGYDNELAAPENTAPEYKAPESTPPAASDATAQPADDTTTGKVQPVVQKPAKRTMMQKIKNFLGIGSTKSKSSSVSKAEPKANEVKVLRTKGHITVPTAASTFELTTGCMLVKGKEPVRIKAAGKEVYVQKGAAAMVMTNGKQLKVITLDNRCGKSVYVVLDDKRHYQEIPLQQLWRFEGNKVAKLKAIVTVEAGKDPRQPKIEQWEVDRMLLNQMLVSHPLLLSMNKPTSPYANHKAMKSFQKTIAAFAVVNAQKRKALGYPMEVPPQPGTYTIWDHFFVK